MERICGWVIRKKIVGQIGILEISSSSVKPYVIVLKKERDKELFDLINDIDIGAAICFEGEASDKQLSKRGVEYLAKQIVIYGKPVEPLPVDIVGKVPALLDTRVRYRYLLLRNPVEKAIFRIRFSVVEAARRFLVENGFIEIHTPKIVAAGAEGGATLFPIQYFENTAYLSQSPQLYKQLLVASVPKVFEVTPYFRAEKYNTTRHLNESWGIDVELGFINSEEDVMRVLESLVTHVINYVRSNCTEELEALNVDLKQVSHPFKRLEFKEAINILSSEGVEVNPNEDLSDAAEKKLGEIMVEKGYELYFITKYPWSASGFYYMREDGHTRKFDLDYKGLEIASGGQREHRLNKLVEAMVDKGLKPENFGFYLEAFKYGMPPHGGFGLGLERLLMKMLDLSNIREATVFVRDRTRLTP